MPKFGVSLYSLYQKFESKEMTPDEGVRWLVENAGVDILEISPVGYNLTEEPELVKKIKSAAGSVPITNYTVGADFLKPVMEEHDAQIVMAKKQVEIGAAMGAKQIRFDCYSWGRPREEMMIENFRVDLPRIIEGYETVCDYAAGFGITILNENHGLYVNGADRIRELMTGVKSKNFGHLLDIGNYICVDEIPEAAIKTVWAFVKHIHVKDFYIRPAASNPGEGFFFTTTYGNKLRGSVVGQGDLNLPVIFNDIIKNKYEGNITLEFEGVEDSFFGVRVGLENARQLYKEALER